ncbi:hypothetical protein HDE76_002128 [Rhodanobacter sp. ANJX3]|uniref:DUF2968 domain-containing protein n=1 Tax=unclassified Rhodanobacter TaxID=2621553 RepID=UPI0015CC920E|nr:MULTISPECIES: DUF2968 domain-containing protein [unclassified Rhodanobacter]MBB5358912.1 hypothetical protein [Rhodanobacter sp. ANJX3]NYE28275.1 hypothetical protein [Rhodanobacter sp. K2T2]
MNSSAGTRRVRNGTIALALASFSVFSVAATAPPAVPVTAPAPSANADVADTSGSSVAYLQHLVDTHQLTEIRTTYNGKYGASELFQPEKLTYFVALFHDKVFWRVIRTDSMKNADDVYRAFAAQTEKLAEVDIDALRLQAGNKYAEQMVTLNQQRLQNLQQDAAHQQQQSQQVAAQQQQAQQQAVSLSNDLRNTSSQLDAVKQQIRALEAQQNSTEIALPPPPETPAVPAANETVPAAAPAPANSTH